MFWSRLDLATQHSSYVRQQLKLFIKSKTLNLIQYLIQYFIIGVG